MFSTSSTSKSRTLWLIVAGLLVMFVGLALPASAGLATGNKQAPKPTIVLVHGAFADASSWAKVTEDLQKDGYTVIAPANPLRGIASDAEYLRSFLDTISGPVITVGHSYGGAVITNATTGNPNVKALVYINAYAPDEGETLIEAGSLGGGHSDLSDHIVARPYPGAAPEDADAYIDPAFFRTLLAQDIPKEQAAALAASQRPIAISTLFTPSGTPAWKTIPSWALVSTEDHSIPVEAEIFMAKRAGSTTVTISSSHLAMISNPTKVTNLIIRAADSTRQQR